MALKRREKLLLGIPALLGCLMLFYYQVHEPLFARRAEAQTRYEQVGTELKQEQAKLTREGDLSARRNKLVAREQLVDSWVPGKNSAALFIWYLSEAEQYSGVEVRGLTATEPRELLLTSQSSKGGAAPPPDQGQSPLSSLIVVGLDLKVDARFAEHLLFQQAIEQMPLFLNVDALGLAHAEMWPLDHASKLLSEGERFHAEQLLRMSPAVKGSYHINLYFKNRKPGPSTDVMHFSAQPGRMDPFVMTGVDDFIRTILNHYQNPGGTGGRRPGDSDPPSPGSGKGQLG